MADDLEMTIGFPLTLQKGWNVLTDPLESNSILRDKINDKEFRVWTLTKQFLNSTAALTVGVLFASCLGAATTFTWTPPGETQTTCRFVEDTFTMTQTGPLYYDLSFQIAEVVTP